MSGRCSFGRMLIAACVLGCACFFAVGLSSAFADEVVPSNAGSSVTQALQDSSVFTKTSVNPDAKETFRDGVDADVLIGDEKGASSADVNGGSSDVALGADAVEKPVISVADAKDDGKQIASGDSKDALKATEARYEDTHTNAYRLYNPNSGEHFYTVNLHEATNLANIGWRWEGIGWVAPLAGSPVFRLYNPNAGDHHYTTSAAERDYLKRAGWRYEGIGWYSDGKDQSVIYRQYNPNAKAGAHNFTVSKLENDHLGSVGWRREGVAWYATDGPTLTIKGQWLVTSAWGGLERYWLASDGNIAKGRFVETNEGSGYAAYAKSNGAVVRGAYNLGNGYVILADNNGKLASTSDGKDGWLVTKAYAGGMQRYYYVAAKRAMRVGFFTIEKAQYFGVENQGYVLRGKTPYKNNALLADNDGKLAMGAGWLVTSKYDGGMQRYWLVKVSGDYSGAKTGLFTVGKSQYYGMPQQGYVARNQYVNSGRWYRANNDGVLTPSAAPEEADMLLRAQGFSSRTNTLILVDTSKCRVGIFKGNKGNWVTDRFEACVCGAPGSPTIRGTYSLGYHLPVLPDWSNALYCTNISGGYFFHSVLSSTSELGQHLSHGCVRVNWPTAQYIQSLPMGSTVNLY